MAELESLQTGRPIREMNIQLQRLPEWIEYFAAICRTHQGTVPSFKGDMVNIVTTVPLGVVGQITPWNHPLLIAIKKIAPAISAGNSVVLKPSELAPINVLKFAELCVDAGLPRGVLNVVCGYGNEAGKALVSNTLIAKLDITGGTETGKLVASQAGNKLIECIAELGGKAPVIVFEDALEDGVKGAAFAAFIASGQTYIKLIVDV
jgi:acyl-CoA reductase-like NAD-dependent aldehyde dehydrogenase